MQLALNPQTFTDWLALIGAGGSIVTIAISAIWKAWTYWREQKQKEWERLHILIDKIHNGSKNGLWVQIAAVHEIKSFKRTHPETVGTIISQAIDHWSKGGNPLLLAELKKLI